jgi:hypothetical protein
VKQVHTEDWFADLYRRLPPDDHGIRAQCNQVDDAFLQRIAFSIRKPSLLDPRVDHVAHCSTCLRRLMELRDARSNHRQFNIPVLSIAAVAAVACCISVLLVHHRTENRTRFPGRPAALVPISATIDLTSFAVTRGQNDTQQAYVALPRATVSATLILPVLSETGAYTIAVSKVRDISTASLISRGTAVQNGARTILEAKLHLESLVPGHYYLSTAHEGDEAVYYYPVRIKP